MFFFELCFVYINMVISYCLFPLYVRLYWLNMATKHGQGTSFFFPFLSFFPFLFPCPSVSRVPSLIGLKVAAHALGARWNVSELDCGCCQTCGHGHLPRPPACDPWWGPLGRVVAILAARSRPRRTCPPVSPAGAAIRSCCPLWEAPPQLHSVCHNVSYLPAQ